MRASQTEANRSSALGKSIQSDRIFATISRHLKFNQYNIHTSDCKWGKTYSLVDIAVDIPILIQVSQSFKNNNCSKIYIKLIVISEFDCKSYRNKKYCLYY